MSKAGKYTVMGTMAALLAVAPLAGCSNSEDVSEETLAEAQITAGLKSETRASGSSWEAGDQIGIYVTGVENTSKGRTSVMASLYYNVLYKVPTEANDLAEASLEPDQTRILFQDSQETVTFAAYYPYSADITATNRTLNISTYDQSEQKSFDLLYASGVTASKENTTVAFTGDHAFNHVLSKLIINLSLGTGFPEDASLENATVKLSGLKHKGTMSLEGEAAGQVQQVTGDTAVNDWDVSSYYGSLLLVPQDLSDAPLTLAITLDGQTYQNATLIAPNMQPGYSYTYNITVNLTGLTLSGSTIKAWVNVAGGEGSATL
jgi:hypothetical protein